MSTNTDSLVKTQVKSSYDYKYDSWFITIRNLKHEKEDRLKTMYIKPIPLLNGFQGNCHAKRT